MRGNPLRRLAIVLVVGMLATGMTVPGPEPAAGAQSVAATPPATPVPATPIAASGSALDRLPLGASDLRETRTSTGVAPGLTLTQIVRGVRSTQDEFAIDVSFEATKTAANDLVTRLAGDGFPARVEEVATRASDDPTAGPLGYRVRITPFPTQDAATAIRGQLIAAGYEAPRVVFTGEDGAATSGPWVVNLLEVDPDQFTGTVTPFLGSDLVPGKERVAEIAARSGALATTNGGYFVVDPTDGTPGDLAGVSLIAGHLLSEAVNGRTALVLPSAPGAAALIATVTTKQTVIASDGATREIDGLNREPGLIRGCGGTGGDAPTEKPKHDFTCTDDSELILSTPAFGQITVAGAGAEVALDASQTVVELRKRRGGEIPRDGSVLSATGDAAGWLAAHAPLGAQLRVDSRVVADGKPLDVSKTTGIVNGGPRLVSDGAINITAAAEGFTWQEDPGFYYRFGVRRNPRTMAGVTTEGKLLLVTVDGRQPGWSVGASFAEEGEIMRALGAVDAVNLDGGGSTAMAVGDKLINRPSDTAGERADGDAIVVLPRRDRETRQGGLLAASPPVS
jgi:hypothetical protein